MQYWIKQRYRISSGLLCILFAGIISGCSGTDPVAEVPTQIQEGMAPMEESVEAEHIIVTYQTYQGSVLTDLDEVLAAINEITIPEIGVEVEFRLVDAQESFAEYPLWISRGETMDLMMLNYQDITTYINRGMLYPLDEWLETEGQDILALHEEGIYVTEGSVVQGNTYGVGVANQPGGNGLGFWVPLSLIEETEFPYEETRIYSNEELANFFAQCKELYPEKYPIGQITVNANYTYYGYYGEMPDALGADIMTGVLNEEDRILNFYELPEYYAFLKQMRAWYEAGYLYPDGAFTDTYAMEMINNGTLLSYPYVSSPSDTASNMFGEEAVCLRTTEALTQSQGSKSIFWTIPATSEQPEAAMRFLNMMYADARISNLIQYGIKSKHYVVLDVETGSIAYPYGVSAQTVGYCNPLGLYGDRRKMYTFDSNEVIRKQQEYVAEARQNRRPFRDFVYSSDRVTMELAAVQKVVERYMPVLESGSVEVDACYEEFLLQLRLAGIDTIVADKQRQYDEWLAQQN